MARKAKKSKAQQAYERTRRNLLQARRRAEKRGSSYYFDLPETVRQQKKAAGQKPTAADYRKADRELKQLRKMFQEAIKRERETAVTLPDPSEQIIDNFLAGLEMGDGGQVIQRETKNMVSRYSPQEVAAAIMEMQESMDLITKAEFYNPEYAVQYVARMGQALVARGAMTQEQFFTLDEELGSYGEYLPTELQ